MVVVVASWMDDGAEAGAKAYAHLSTRLDSADLSASTIHTKREGMSFKTKGIKNKKKKLPGIQTLAGKWLVTVQEPSR